MLEASQLAEYQEMVHECGMTVLLEVHDEADLEKSELTGLDTTKRPLLVGINNRDLSHFETDLKTSESLRPKIPADIPVASESGIESRQDIARLQQAGIRIFLIGESLLKSGDIKTKLKEFIGG